MNKGDLLEVLRGIGFLRELAPTYLDQVASISRFREVDEGMLVFHEGEAAAQAYLVVSGNVSLEICAAGTGCRRILTIGPGELLGWSAVLDQTCFTATARTLEPTLLIQTDAAQLLSMCERNPELGFELMRRTALALSKRLSATRIQLLDVYGVQLPGVANEGGSKQCS
ncbi:MAG: Crp/Fnr family transcriptional regulator [Planctomycetes bacterium]|nr:Crp/Fnr family transcriptional regulator [Planctomycetota bacterium]